MMHSVMTVEEDTGRIVGLQFPQGEISGIGLSEDGKYRNIRLMQEDVPDDERCSDFAYFIDHYCYDKRDGSFVEIPTRINNYATWDIPNSRWVWDSALVLADIRGLRNRMLVSTDWTQIPDNVLTDAQKSEAQTYRTALRNITNSLDNPENEHGVSWPTAPSFLA